jgi:hypothetical protein
MLAAKKEKKERKEKANEKRAAARAARAEEAAGGMAHATSAPHASCSAHTMSSGGEKREGGRAGAVRATPGRAALAEVTQSNTVSLPPLLLAEELRQGLAMPGRLFLDAGSYFTYARAQRQAGRMCRRFRMCR